METLLDEPILIIKTAWGGKSLHTDFRPPGAGPYEFHETQLQRFREQNQDVEQIQADTDRDYWMGPEEAIAYGCRKFIACGGAGALNRELTLGHVLIPYQGIAGTSGMTPRCSAPCFCMKRRNAWAVENAESAAPCGTTRSCCPLRRDVSTGGCTFHCARWFTKGFVPP